MINLGAVRASLQQLQTDPTARLDHRAPRVATLDARSRANLVHGYRYLGERDLDERWLQPGHSHDLLELNHLVLYGDSQSRRRRHARALAHAERRFYQARSSGIGNLVDWYRLNRRQPIWALAAGLYIRILGNPQLFVEGNHRTAALIISRLLIEAQRPPFVLTPRLAPDWLSHTADIQSLKRHGLRSMIRTQPVRQALATLLEVHSDSRYLQQSRHLAAVSS